MDTLEKNGWGAEIPSIMKNYGMLRLKNCFSEEEKAELQEPGAESRLTKDAEGKWCLRPVKHTELYVRVIDGINNV